MEIGYQNITIDTLHDELFTQKQITLNVLRLDKIDPIISGNKLFKLHYFLDEVRQKNKKNIITFGGAYSNHLAATAYTCKLKNISCIGIVRGNEPKTLSHTLQHCIQNNMQLQFLSREDYDKKEDANFLFALQQKHEDAIIIPEGGYDALGSNGAALIMNLVNNNYTHICVAVGTATTVSGILQSATNQQVIAIPVLKGMMDIEERIYHLSKKKYTTAQLQIWHNYHFGGYAKKTNELISFMNAIWLKHMLPLDFVYTAKAFYGVIDNINNNFFSPSSNILFIHTGGLQGNASLPKNTLLF